MDIYSNTKQSKHSRPPRKPVRGKKNVFVRIKDWFLALAKWKKAVLITVLSITLVLSIITGYMAIFVADLVEDYQYEEVEDPEIEQIIPIAEGITNIALFGIDTRTQGVFSGNSDSIMILSINSDTGKIKVISVMRDSLVKIPGMKENKINAAYGYGGPALAIKTLNQTFGLDIKEYATVNFFGMSDIIDAVGGIEVNVLERELVQGKLNGLIIEQANHRYVKPQFVEKPGLQNLSGMQAVAWARIRNTATEDGVNDDYGRTDRQRYVMEQLLNKALALEYSQYPKLIKAMLPYMQTSLSFSEIIELAGILTKDITFEQTRIPQHSYVMAGPRINRVGSYVYFNLDYAKRVVHSVIYDGISQEEFIAANGVVRQGWYTGPVDAPPAEGEISSEEESGDASSGDSSDMDSSDSGSQDGSEGSGSNSSGSNPSDGNSTSGETSGGESSGGESGGGGQSGTESSGGGGTPPSTSNPDDGSGETQTE